MKKDNIKKGCPFDRKDKKGSNKYGRIFTNDAKIS